MLTQDGSVPFIPGSSRMRIVLAAVAFLGAMLAVESAYSQFVQALVPALPGVFSGSVAWGDYDNDSRLDFLIAGSAEDGNVSQLWRNNLLASNSPPDAPTGLSAIVSGTTVVHRHAWRELHRARGRQCFIELEQLDLSGRAYRDLAWPVPIH